MEHISIKNLDKFQPHYKDNRLILWIRWDIEAIRDYKISKLNPSQRWLFIGLIGLACKQKNIIPFDKNWISEEIRYPVKSILLDLKKLQELELIVTNCNELLQKSTYNTVHTVHNNTDNSVIVDFFNYYLLKTKKAFRLTPTNRDFIRKRLNEGYTIAQLKQAVDNFILDDWEGRANNLDLIYCIGHQKGKPDHLEKWLNKKPKTEVSKWIQKT